MEGKVSNFLQCKHPLTLTGGRCLCLHPISSCIWRRFWGFSPQLLYLIRANFYALLLRWRKFLWAFPVKHVLTSCHTSPDAPFSCFPKHLFDWALVQVLIQSFFGRICFCFGWWSRLNGCCGAFVWKCLWFSMAFSTIVFALERPRNVPSPDFFATVIPRLCDSPRHAAFFSPAVVVSPTALA